MATKVRTAEMSWRAVEEVIQRQAVVLVPMASTEEHGPISPTGDYLLTDAICERAAQKTDAVITPVIPFGYSEYFRNYPGTITLQAETLRRLVYDTVSCLLDQGFRHVVLVNGHTGNRPVLQPLIRQIRRERGILIPIIPPGGPNKELTKELYGDTPLGHGGESAGSRWAYLRPELIDERRAADFGTSPFLGLKADGLDGVRFKNMSVGLAINMEDVTPPSGSMVDPRGISAEKGRRLIESAVDDVAAFIEWFKTVDPNIEP